MEKKSSDLVSRITSATRVSSLWSNLNEAH